MLGKKGTFVFCAVVYLLAFLVLFLYYNSLNKTLSFWIVQLFFVPVLIYFVVWFLQVNKNEDNADFRHTMRMNKLASTLTNLAFITLLILNQLD